MSYISDFYFDNNQKIVLPLDFFNGFPSGNSDEINELIKEKEILSVLSDDVMTVKQYKRLDEINELLLYKNINAKNFKTASYENKYGFMCIETNSYVMASNFIDQNSDYNFALIYANGKEIAKTITQEAEVIFEKKENGYVLKSLVGSKSNNSWVEEKFVDIISKLGLSVIVKDGGNEEIGFVFEDGVDDENGLEKDRVYVNGVLKR